MLPENSPFWTLFWPIQPRILPSERALSGCRNVFREGVYAPCEAPVGLLGIPGGRKRLVFRLFAARMGVWYTDWQSRKGWDWAGFCVWLCCVASFL